LYPNNVMALRRHKWLHDAISEHGFTAGEKGIPFKLV